MRNGVRKYGNKASCWLSRWISRLITELGKSFFTTSSRSPFPSFPRRFYLAPLRPMYHRFFLSLSFLSLLFQVTSKPIQNAQHSSLFISLLRVTLTYKQTRRERTTQPVTKRYPTPENSKPKRKPLKDNAIPTRLDFAEL